jgi:hypothetical protein
MADDMKEAVLKGGLQGGLGKVLPKPKEPVPSEVADKLQDMKNKKGADQYQKTKKFARGGGIEVRGKTKGRFV